MTEKGNRTWFPQSMQKFDQWVCWDRVWDNEREEWKKVPINPKTQRYAKPNDRNTWGTFAEAMNASAKCDGIGFVFTKEDPYVFVDVDHCWTDEGEFTETAREFRRVLNNTYCEVSQSSEGLHFICVGELESGFNNRKEGVEFYDSGRFVAMTGNVLQEFEPTENEHLQTLWEKYTTKKPAPQKTENVPQVVTNVDKVMQMALRNDLKLITLYEGDTSAYESQSEGDMALCMKLAFYCGKNEYLMDRYFRESALMRDKWDEFRGAETYGQLTIRRACDRQTEVYKPKDRVPENEYDLADMVYLQMGGDFCYTKGKGWFAFDNGVWVGSTHRRGNVQPVRNAFQKFVSRKSGKKWNKWKKNSVCEAVVATLEDNCTVEEDLFDRDPFTLCTPSFAINLRTGERTPHMTVDENGVIHENTKGMFLSKCTTVDPSDEGAELWDQFLDEFTCCDNDLKLYNQYVAGMALVGEVYEEKLIVAQADGGNGKSTYFGALSDVLGDYAVTMSPEILLHNRNKKENAYVSLEGARLCIVGETGEDRRLDENSVKKLSSIDPITCEPKFKAEYSFKPSHTCVLFTNHLPRVGSTDYGTWRRLVALPCPATFSGSKGEKKNYKKELVEKAGGAILQWAIMGAKLFCEAEMNLPTCGAVEEATQTYKRDSDWLQGFIEERCVEVPTFDIKLSVLYAEYKRSAEENGEYVRTLKAFSQELHGRGYEILRRNDGRHVIGLQLEREDIPF